MKHALLFTSVTTWLINVVTLVAVFSGDMKAGDAAIPLIGFSLISSIAWGIAFGENV